MLSMRIKTLRLARHYSQVDLAKELCVTKQSVSNWENDNIQPSIDILEKLADLFGVTTDYLLGRSQTKTINADGLTDIQIQHIGMIINDIRTKPKIRK